MASELRVDTLKDSSGNNSVGMAYVAGGSAKAWINLNGSSITDPASLTGVNDSFNAASVLDHSAGIHTTNFTSGMNNANYSTVTASNLDQAYAGVMCIVTQTGSSVKTKTAYGSSHAGTDTTINCFSIFGDLA